ncbi:tautomerase family protein [Streptomyces qinzhouensis]|uniref:Tautomerase n=1 Tax=Streptomyces qinzhouensis TaxID=2599401 RepID=A0A5B8JCD1_9ACTN|nr:4-oxalocrotonate tautomerase family protein [Streptomyces qinzhouensis]QDY79475.1 4-oxalocrotonate tautomerase family protein [Streptomyces qinzhouensis]
MPYVNVRITREGATAEQKARIIAGVTELLVEVLAKDPATTFVVIDEVEQADWGVGGLPVDEYRRRARAAVSAPRD